MIESMIEPFGDGRDWFLQKQYGMFVHWGLYAIPARHEQIQWRGGIPRDEYAQLAGEFNPADFDPDAWLDLAADAGMEYLCVTAKHHDGFCLWDTAETDFNVTNTPFGRDVIAMIADACGRRGVPLCIYYSVVDWRHPNYPNRGRHHELPGPQPGDEPDLQRYMAFLRAQVRELCTNYGEIHGFWWDMNVAEHRDPSINAMIRELQPNAVINNRGMDAGDFGTPERNLEPETHRPRAYDRPTEYCQSVGRWSWGYKADEDYFTSTHLSQAIDAVRSRGGNVLLNVGPTAAGVIPDESADILRRLGRWYKSVREAYDGGELAGELVDDPSTLVTRRGETLYVHLPADPTSSAVVLKPLDVAPSRAVLLNTGRALQAEVKPPNCVSADPAYLIVRDLPRQDRPEESLVVRLDFDRLPG